MSQSTGVEITGAGVAGDRVAGGLSRLWHNERSRGVIMQLALVFGLALFFAFIISNTIANLQSAGLASGYGFLTDTASFDINQRLIEYSSTSTYGRALIIGGLNTILIAVMGVALATLVGFVAGVLRLSPNFLVSRLVGTYVEITRNVPLLLQIIFWWVILLALPKVRDSLTIGDAVFLNNSGIAVPAPVFLDGFFLVPAGLVVGLVALFAIARWSKARQESTGQTFPVAWVGLALVVGLPAIAYLAMGQPVDWNMPEANKFGRLRGGLNITPELVALWLALSFYTGAFIAEIVRAGIQSVPRGQSEAASALGLPRGLTMRKIILPQALRVIIPPLTSQYLNLTKNSSLAVAIGYQDIVSIGDTVLNQSGQALEVVSIFMGFYLTLSLATSLFMNWYNKRIALVER